MNEDNLSEINNLAELENLVSACKKCPLHETRTKIVFGVGNQTSELMFIGEAPGFHEDQKGEPFVGAAGRYLDKLLISVLGLTRKDIFIANVLKCRPPGNRDPLPDEIACCRPFLDKQIELIDPKVLCTLGNHAGRVILDEKMNISRVHGEKSEFGNRWIFPVYHPAAALYAGRIKEVLIEDFKKLGELLAGEAFPKKEDSNPVDQMDLF